MNLISETRDRVNAIADEYVTKVRNEIKAYCLDRNVNFETTYFTKFYNSFGVEHKTILSDHIIKMVYAHDDIFGCNFPNCIFKNGEWV